MRVRPTWPSSAISKVSSRLPIRVTVSSAMSVMFENIASSSWLVVRSSWEFWEYWKYCENIWWFSKILHRFHLDQADKKFDWSNKNFSTSCCDYNDYFSGNTSTVSTKSIKANKECSPFVSVPWTPWWSCVDLWGRTSPTIWGLSRPPRRS